MTTSENWADRVRPGGVLVGTLRRAYDLSGGANAACVLVTEDGQAFHLNSLEGEEAGVSALSGLQRYESRLVQVAFRTREETVFGPSLFGVRIEDFRN